MTPEEVLALAQSGHPKIITAIMNRSTQVHDISVRVARKDNCLHVLIEGEAIADHDLLTTFVQASFKKLRINPEFTVRLYGRRRGDRAVSWSRKFEMATMSGTSTDESNGQTSTLGEAEMTDSPPLAEPQSESPVESNGVDDMAEGDRQMDAHPLRLPAKNADADAIAAKTPAEEATNTAKFPMEPSPWDSPSQPDIHSEEIHSDNMRSDELRSDELPGDALASPPMTHDETLQATTSSMTDPMFDPANSPDSALESSPAFSYEEPQPAELPEMQLDAEAPSPPESISEMATPEEFDRDDEDPEAIDFQEIAKQPEALVLILFAIMLYIWQLYTALMADAAPDGSVSGRELAERLGVNQSTISRRKFQDDFAAWTAHLDPDGIAWSYDQGMFVPQIPDFGTQSSQ